MEDGTEHVINGDFRYEMTVSDDASTAGIKITFGDALVIKRQSPAEKL